MSSSVSVSTNTDNLSDGDLARVSEVDDKQYNVSARDINTIISTINIVSRRGGFIPAEFAVIGDLFDRLSKLVPPQPNE